MQQARSATGGGCGTTRDALKPDSDIHDGVNNV